MVLNIENHHPNRKDFPTLTVSIARKEHQTVHGLLPICTELYNKVRQYDTVVKMIVATKNWCTSYEKDFGEKPAVNVTIFNKLRKSLHDEIYLLATDDLRKVESIMKIPTIYMAKLFAYAHPDRFLTLRKFLHYCGYTATAKISKKYSRKAHATGFQITSYFVMRRHPIYYPLYLKIKQDLIIRFPSYSKMKIDRMARNRVGTILFKDIYHVFYAERSLRS